MAKLARTVYVRDPDRHRTVILHAGEEPEPRLAALVTNPDAWEDGKPPAAAKKDDRETSESAPSGGDVEDTKPAAKKTAATRPARGRKSAGEGDS